ncbi:MAG: arginine--tRNA ligase [Rhodospirillales bacterium]|nr:arginine--tRNA ligase [Rhodospirillales bacterium]
MNLFQFFADAVSDAVAALAGDGVLPDGLDTARVAVEPPRDAGHGDVTTNAAMVLAKSARMKPRELAAALAGRLAAMESVADVEVAGPGFINLRLAHPFWHERLRDILKAGSAYGDSTSGAGTAVNIEFVSANPTGPLHVGHGRGAVVGDVLAALLEKAGYRVTREYYVNDAGAQVDALARSLHFRYREALGEDAGAFPEGLYPGDYLVPVAEDMVRRDGDRWRNAEAGDWLPAFRDVAAERMLALISDDLALLGVRFDVMTSERRLVADGKVEAALATLAEMGLLYEGVLEPPKGMLPDDWEPRPQTLFRATLFGDDVDRPLKKSDGSWTYFATDIAYHLDKYRRGFASMIDVWGADHGGYVKRMRAAVKAISDGHADLDVKLCQMVNLLDGGQPVKMSKRAGSFITMREVVERVGRDVFRFVMLTRKNDAQLDFDFEAVVEQSRENPVFYVQYAHARCRSVLRHAAGELGAGAVTDAALAATALERLTDQAELDLIRQLAAWPRLVETAAAAHEPHRVAFFLQEVAASFHVLWTKGKDDARLRFITPSDVPMTLARLALVRAVQAVLASGLEVFGVEPVEELR